MSLKPTWLHQDRATHRPTLDEALGAARATVVDDRVDLDAGALAGAVDRLAGSLRARGVGHGSTVAWQAANRWEALALYRSNDRTDPLDLANALRPLAILEEAAGHTDSAAALWREARDLYARANVAEGAAECAARLDGLGA